MAIRRVTHGWFALIAAVSVTFVLALAPTCASPSSHVEGCPYWEVRQVQRAAGRVADEAELLRLAEQLISTDDHQERQMLWVRRDRILHGGRSGHGYTFKRPTSAACFIETTFDCLCF
jgi:hypothetical protein